MESKQKALSLKKKILQCLIALDIISWLEIDYSLHYYAQILALENAHQSLGLEYSKLLSGATFLILGSSLVAMLVHVTGLAGSITESTCLLTAYYLFLIFGASLMTLLAVGNSSLSWYWSINALWCSLLIAVTYDLLRTVQHCKRQTLIENLSEILKA